LEKIKKIRERLISKGVLPEFLNRFDEIILFDDLSAKAMTTILRDQLADFRRTNLESLGLDIVLSKEAEEKLALLGYIPSQGARPLRKIREVYINQPFNEVRKANKQEVYESGVIGVDYDKGTEHFIYGVLEKGSTDCKTMLGQLTRRKAEPISADQGKVPGSPKAPAGQSQPPGEIPPGMFDPIIINP
jgi:hypothetical protein